MESQCRSVPLFAWLFDLGDREDGVQVVFARNEARAQILAGRQSGGGRGDRSEVTRVPQFDKYVGSDAEEGDNPSSEDFWNEGYTVTCFECEHVVGTDPCWRCIEFAVAEAANRLEGDGTVDEDAIEQAVGVPLAFEGGVFCCQGCVDAYTARRDRRKTKRAAAEAALLERFPFVRVIRSWVGGSGACDRDREPAGAKKCYDRDPDNVCVDFKVPGGELSEKTADGYATHNVFCYGCQRAWVAKGDLDAFRCHAERRSAGRSAEAAGA
jgi:hypothetical protein